MFCNKNIIRCLILAGVTIIFYNILVFVIPFTRTSTFWVSYVFTWIALVVGFMSIAYSFSKGADAKNWFYGFPIAKAGSVYLILQFILGLIGMIFAKLIFTWLWLVVSIIPLGIAIFWIIISASARDDIQCMDEKFTTNISNMRSLQSKSAALVSLSNNEIISSELIRLAEKFKYSDIVSCEATEKLEFDLEQLLFEIETAIINNSFDDVDSLCKKTTIMLNERNRICKLNKGR